MSLKTSPEEDSLQVVLLDPDDICRMDNQPRKIFDDAQLNALAESIRTHGQNVPIRVFRNNRKEPPRYSLVVGECRKRACKIIGRKVAAIIQVARTPADHLEQAIVENVGRRDLSAWELAPKLWELRRAKGYKAPDLAGRIGMNRVSVVNYLRLENLDPSIFALLDPRIPRPKRLGVATGMKLSEYPVEDQRRLVEKVLGVIDVKAVRYIERHAIHDRLVKSKTSGKNLPPVDKYDLLRRFLKQTTSRVKELLESDQGYYFNLFKGHSEQDVDKMIREIEVAVKDLASLGDFLKFHKEKLTRKGKGNL